MPVKVVKIRSDQRAEMFDLRWRVLKKPLGMPPESSHYKTDDEADHFAIIDNQKMMATLSAYRRAADMYVITHLAVDPKAQGAGYGKKLARYAESFARSLKVKTILLFGRADVLPFYMKLGYKDEGVVNHKYGIAHHKLMKDL